MRISALTSFLHGTKKGIPGLDGAAHLGELLDVLMGADMTVRANEPRIKALSQNDAQTLAKAVTERILQAGELQKKPIGIAGQSSVFDAAPAVHTRQHRCIPVEFEPERIRPVGLSNRGKS